MAKFIDKRPSALRLFWSFPGWFGLIFLVAGLGVEVGAMFAGRNAMRLAGDGVEVTGEVLGKDWRESRDSDGDRTVSYYVQFRFPTRDGVAVEDEVSVGRGTYNDTEIGDRVPVRYWLDDPMLNEIEPGATRFLAMMLGLFGVPFSLVGGFFVWRQARFARRAVRLRDRGEQRTATVLAHVPTAYKVNNRRQYALQWQDEAGISGQSRPTGAARLLDYPPGATITVYADGNGAVWEGDAGAPRRGYCRSQRGENLGPERRLPDAETRGEENRPPTVRRR